MIVTDTQILAYYTIKGPHTELAQRVRVVDGGWIMPPLWRSEFRSILAGYLRRGEMTASDAIAAFHDAELLLLADRVPSPDLVIQLIASSKCTAYDLEFVAVAQSLGVKLVTNDKEVLAAFPKIAVSPAQFAS